MNLDQLHYLSVLAQTENYTQAAKLLNITQPTLSYAIKTLESQLGIALFEKVGRNVRLTANGRLFVQESDQAVEGLNRAIERIHQVEQEGFRVRISSLRILGSHFLPHLLRDFLAATADDSIRFEFAPTPGFSQAIIEGLRNEQYDICFCSKVDNQNDVDYYPVLEQKLYLITPKDHPLAKLKSVNLQDTFAYPHITYASNTGLANELSNLYALCGRSPMSSYSVSEDVEVAGLVSAGFGIGVVPQLDNMDRLDLAKIPIAYPQWHRFVYMAVLKEHYQNPAAQKFINYVKKQKFI
ncbi:LysR family transcriptional regulator [Limosilactobacillus fermentum]|uniref:LysR family transcriptional regulator n=1 Tax=Limosilactobacillus fermentum TaxID=1613 RepID=UPI0030F03324